MAEPTNLRQLDELKRITGMTIRPVLAMRSAIDRMLAHCYEENFAVDAVTADLEENSLEIRTDAIDTSSADVESLIDGSPMINLVNYIIVYAIRQKASDIHIEAGQQSSLVRYRVDGHLREVLRPRREFHPAMISPIKVIAKLDISEHRMPQDGRVHLTIDGREIDLRISTLPTILGEKIVMRVLDRKNVTFYLDKLGMPDEALVKTKSLLNRPHGLLLTTGPTGSGKTTTLYSAVELIKSIKRNIVTVEDPVEYQLDMINQVQVSNTKTMKFSDALRSILRQDPDVIMVGEIRDAETAAIAIQAALTGHLVLSTLHTNDSFSAVTRLLDMGIEPFKLSAALLGIIAQRLVRTVCSSCKTSYYPGSEQLDAIRYQGDRRRQFVRGQGCRECYDTGFRGRTGIYDKITVSIPPMQFQYIAKDRQGKLIAGTFEGENALSIRQRLRSQGLFALKIEPTRLSMRVAMPVQSKTQKTPFSLMGEGRVNTSDLIVALSQLSIMCQSGDDLAEALKTVANQCCVPSLRRVLLSSYEEVSQGSKFSVALAKHPKVFNESMVAAIAIHSHIYRIRRNPLRQSVKPSVGLQPMS